MKNDCNIVRDLMPLVIDGAASEESAQIVEEHVTACEPCATVYEELKGEIHAEALAKEQAEFEKAAKQMQRRKRIRKLLTIGLPVLAAVLLLIGCGLLVNRMHDTLVPMTAEEYNVQLFRIPDTDQIVSVWTGMEEAATHGTANDYDFDKNEVRLRTHAQKHLFSLPWEKTASEYFMQYMICSFVGDKLVYSSAHADYHVVEIAIGEGDERRVIYRDGDEIPLASPELTDYYNACKGASYYVVGESAMEQAMRIKERDRLKDLVPEFQTK